jgi:myosin heavy subunit
MNWKETLQRLFNIPFPADMHYLASNFHIFGAGACTNNMVEAATRAVQLKLLEVKASDLLPLLTRDIGAEVRLIPNYVLRESIRSTYEKEIVDVWQDDRLKGVVHELGPLWRRLALLQTVYPLVPNVEEVGLLRMQQQVGGEKELLYQVHSLSPNYEPPLTTTVQVKEKKNENENVAITRRSKQTAALNEKAMKVDDVVQKEKVTKKKIKKQNVKEKKYLFEMIMSEEEEITFERMKRNIERAAEIEKEAEKSVPNKSSTSSSSDTSKITTKTKNTTTTNANTIQQTKTKTKGKKIYFGTNDTKNQKDNITLLRKRIAIAAKSSSSSRVFNQQSLDIVGFQGYKWQHHAVAAIELLLRTQSGRNLPWPNDYTETCMIASPLNCIMRVASRNPVYPSLTWWNDFNNLPTGFNDPRIKYKATTGVNDRSFPEMPATSGYDVICKFNQTNNDITKLTTVLDLIQYITKNDSRLKNISTAIKSPGNNAMKQNAARLKEWDRKYQAVKESKDGDTDEATKHFGLREFDCSYANVSQTLRQLSLLTNDIKALLDNAELNDKKKKPKKKKTKVPAKKKTVKKTTMNNKLKTNKGSKNKKGDGKGKGKSKGKR